MFWEKSEKIDKSDRLSWARQVLRDSPKQRHAGNVYKGKRRAGVDETTMTGTR